MSSPDGSRSLLSSFSLLQITEKYIPIQLKYNINKENTNIRPNNLVEGNGEEIMQSLMDNSRNALKMYGTAKEFAENVKIYRNFAGNDHFFHLDYSEPFHSPPIVYQSLKNEKYICKQDLFVWFQKFVQTNYKNTDIPLILTAMSVFLKKHQEKLQDCYEFVPFKDEEFERMETELNSLIDTKNKEKIIDQLGLETNKFLDLKKFTFEEVLSQWKTLFPFEWNHSDFQLLQSILKLACRDFPIKTNVKYYRGNYIFLQNLFDSFKTIIEARSNWFLPYSPVTKSVKPILRLFEDGPNKFLLVTEVCKVSSEVDTLPSEKSLPLFRKKYGKDYQKICGSCWLTISFEQFEKDIGKEIEMIEIIRTPVLRAKHRAVQIIQENGDHCLLAADVLLEILRELIYGFQVFQRAKNDNRIKGYILRFFEQVLPYFNPVLDTYVLDTIAIGCVYEYVVQNFDSFLSKPAKAVRNFKKVGFTVQDLKNELINLSILEMFPEVTEHAERVYEEVLKAKTESTLRTSDLFDAVEHCQLICIFNNFPNLAKFLHNQNACNRIYRKCQFCPKSSEISSINENYKSPEKKQEKEQSPESVHNSEQVQDFEENCHLQDTHNCENCIKHIEKVKKANEKVISERNRAINLDRKVKGNEKKLEEAIKKEDAVLEERKKVNEQLGNKDEKIEMLEEKITAHRNGMKELENLRKQISDYNKAASELRNSIEMQKSGTAQSESKLKNRTSQLERKLNSEKNEIDQRERRISELKVKKEALAEMRRLEAELEKKKEENKKLRDAKKRLQCSNDVKEQEIQLLYDRLTSSSSTPKQNQAPCSSSSTTSHTSSEPQLSDEMRNILYDLLNKKDRLISTNAVSRAQDMSCKLIALSEDNNIKKGARFAYLKFNNDFNTYMTILNNNIKKIQSNVNITQSEIEELPPYPALLTEFEKHYAIAIKKEQTDSRRSMGGRKSEPSGPGPSRSSPPQYLSSQYGASHSGPSRPDSSRPSTSQPGTSQFGLSQSGSTRSSPFQSGPSQPDSSRPSTLQLGTSQFGPSQFGLSQSGTSRSSPFRSGPSPPGSSQPGTAQSGPPQSGPSQPRPAPLGPSRSGTPRRYEPPPAPIQPEDRELDDQECLICFDDMLSTDGTSKCKHCCRRYHAPCIRKWLQTKTTCPACYHLFLDDGEYPHLG